MEEPEVIRIPPLAYLRAVLALAWGVIRHPLSITYIDMLTGRAVYIPIRRK